MACSYYTFRQGDYYCTKKGDYVNSDVYYKYCRNYDYDDCPVYKGDTSGGCYITSACVYAMELKDNCHELEMMRFFRDSWLKHQDGGDALIAEYYKIAPMIVNAINTKKDSREIYQEIYEKMVLPCVKYIDQGMMQEAFEIYQSGTMHLKEQFVKE